MKKILFTFCAGLCVFSYGQDDRSGMEKRGDMLFARYDYPEAAKTLEAVKRKDADVYRKLGESYDMLEQFDLAEKNYALAVTSQGAIPQDRLNYARVLMKNGKYAQAETAMKEYAALSPSDASAKRFELMEEQLSKFAQFGKNFSVGIMEMNSDAQDFAPVKYEGKLYFASTRNTKPGIVYRRWNANRLPFLDIFVAEENSQDAKSAWLLKDKDVNKKYHDGPIAFSADGKWMFITRSQITGRSVSGVRNFSLLVSEKMSDGWSEPRLFPFESKEYSIGHAAMSPDGNILVFASDMPGGKGGVDLYKVTRVGTSWSSPVNLESVNTSGDEMFPFFQGDGLLLFASDGLPGYGGLDLFAGQWKNGEVKRFQNVGAPVNSAHDDFSIWMDPAMTTGYFASNRTGGKGHDDLYRFTLSRPITFGRSVNGMARSKTGEPLADTRIIFRDASGKVLGEALTDASGRYAFETESTGNFELSASKVNYFAGRQKFMISDDTPEDVMADVVLDKDPGFALAARITDRQSAAPLDNVKITLTNNMTGAQEVLRTDEMGEILSPIRDKKLNDRISYNLRIEKDGYAAKTVTYNKELNKEGEYKVDEELNLSLQKMSVGVDLAKAIDLRPIYFDLGKFAIRPDAALELEKIVRIMNENPTMIVELGAHTDCRGTAKKNQELSQKRAIASATYIQKRISNPSRISGVGYGESRILNGCECEGKVKPLCTEDEHSINRRTEFIVVKM